MAVNMLQPERVMPDSYFDESDLDGLYEIPIALETPTRLQKKEIEFLKTIYRGVMLVTGKPRSGKDLFAVSLCKLNKYYFRRPILLDFKPKRLFGEYRYFSPVMMVQEINKMAKMAAVDMQESLEEKLSKKDENIFADATKEWMQGNEVMFQGAILYLSELKRYCYNRNPHSRMNKFIGSLCTIWGHLDLLIVGTHVQAHEIDRYSFLNYVTHWVNCSWSLTRTNTTDAKISRGTYLSEQGMFDVALKPIIYHVDGGAPREFLSGGNFFSLYNTKNMVNLRPVMSKEMM